MNQLVDLTIREAGSRLAAREISAVELLESTFERIAETEPHIHAFANVMEVSARRDALRADRDLVHGSWRGPLHGIPIALKDLIYTTEAPTEAGSRVLAGWTPPYDATVVSRLREGGAVIVGKAHTHEFAYGVNIPPTRNPWRLDAYPGGSSAGSGAAVSARSAFGALGTDGGGSIRCPASVNGIVGLKPTTGRVSRRGVVPMSSTFDNVGPMTRTVEDCALMLGVIAGHDPADIESMDRPVPDFTARLNEGVRGMRFGVERDYFFSRAVDDVRNAIDRALHFLAAEGNEIVELHIPELELAVPTAMPPILADTTAFHRTWIRQRSDRYEPSTRVMIELGELIPATHYIRAQRARRVLRDRIRSAFEMYRLDALVAPTLPMPTVPVEDLNLVLNDASGDSPGSSYFRQCVIANVVGIPALSVPAGFSQDDLPIGITFFGRPLDEQKLFQIARSYEARHEWHRRSPEFRRAVASAS